MGMPQRMVFSAHQGPLISVTASACKAVKGMSVCKHLLDHCVCKNTVMWNTTKAIQTLKKLASSGDDCKEGKNNF